MPRPSFKPTKQQRKLVHSLSAIGVRQEQIAPVIGLRSPKTLRKHFQKDIAKGVADATAKVAATAYEMAASGNFAGMTRFWISTIGGGLDLPPNADAREVTDDAEALEGTDAEE